MKAPRIAAAVVLYNPDEEVVANIASYSDGLDVIYCLDNSDKICPAVGIVLNAIKALPYVHYISMRGNKGIACALNHSLKMAGDDGYKYLLTMDQDSSFQTEMWIAFRIRAVELMEQQTDVILCSANPGLQTKEMYLEKHEVITSGNLVNIDLASSIGYDEDFFIDLVDHDFCWTAREHGYRIMMLPNISMKHHLGTILKKRMLGAEIEFTTHDSQRYYYMVRNKFYLLDKHKASIDIWCRFVLGTIAGMFRIVLLEDQKKSKIKAVLIGMRDFLRGKGGARDC